MCLKKYIELLKHLHVSSYYYDYYYLWLYYYLTTVHAQVVAPSPPLM